MRRIASLIGILERWERILLAVFVTLFVISFGVLLRRFLMVATELQPETGGTYIEGSVGQFLPLNPWFTIQNDVNRDIVSLVFSGLLRYNPTTRQIEDDLATLSVSDDARIYTLTLKEDIFWHDSTPEDPHPVTPEDVLFTFRTIQNPKFPNTILRQNFDGVEIEKTGTRTVRFRLPQPYSFFASNLTIGLLPERAFQGIPVERLDQAVDFGFAPIGAGPYAFRSIAQTELSTEVTLERFPRAIDPPFRIQRIIFRIFPEYSALLSDIRNLDGVRLVPRNDDGDPIIPRQFRVVHYVLPQYVALFLNLERPMLQDPKLRLGLQLGTNKQEIVDAIHESLIVDTPLLEIDTEDWRYQHDPAAAQGALFESNWHLPEKVRLQRMLEIRDANNTGVLRMDPIVLLDTGAVLTVTGSLIHVNTGATLNGIRIQRHPTQSGAWIAALPTKGSGSLGIGLNVVRLVQDGKIVDTAYVWRTAHPQQFRMAAEEQRLVDLFVASREKNVPEGERITVSDLILDKGMLRLRLSTDPTDIRVNDAGERLSLRLLTSSSPPHYARIAEMIRSQWASLGVQVTVDIPETRQAFEDRVLQRDYDILLFGQSLLDNLDSYPYWHSSGIQKTGGSKHELRIDAYNLSQYASPRADTLLEDIRRTTDVKKRQENLQKLREILKNDVPAIFLYSPLYTFGYVEELRGVELGKLSMHSDRFLTLRNWYLRQERRFRPGVSWLSFFPWLFGFGPLQAPADTVSSAVRSRTVDGPLSAR